ncbi:MAG: ribosome maturation factor RimP [Bacteroidetes bacterium]|nr:ribosome maturation factor RimP [Bacteroidota bacterium]MDA1120826.1 ribosome maturation factor RimP [Bacteroidota bacterium]
MIISEKVKELVEQSLNEDLFVVDIIVNGGVLAKKVLVLVDGDNGIAIDQCADISRQLSEKMDELDLFEGRYKLEVSSPGIDHPIVLYRQYVKNKGRYFVVTTKENKKIRGMLMEVDEDTITLSMKEKKEIKNMEIPFNEIVMANVLVSFK